MNGGYSISHQNLDAKGFFCVLNHNAEAGKKVVGGHIKKPLSYLASEMSWVEAWLVSAVCRCGSYKVKNADAQINSKNSLEIYSRFTQDSLEIGGPMSINIVIQQKGIDQQMTVSKVNIPELDGGTCAWVPEDETQLDELTVTQNGDYSPSRYGFSKVTVDVDTPAEPVFGELIPTQNGTYNPADYGWDGFSSVKTNVHGDSPVYTRIYFYSEPLIPPCAGYPIDLTGVEVHAVKSDSTEEDITDQCMFVPQDGAIVPEGTTVVPLTAFWDRSNV